MVKADSNYKYTSNVLPRLVEQAATRISFTEEDEEEEDKVILKKRARRMTE